MARKSDFVSLLQQADDNWNSYSAKEEKRKAKKVQRAAVMDYGLNRGYSWEKISKDTGIPLKQVQSYSQKTRPDYGIAAPPPSNINRLKSATIGRVQNYGQRLVTDPGAAGVAKSQSQAQEGLLKILQDPKAPMARRKVAARFAQEQGILGPQEANKYLETVNATSPANVAKEAGKALVQLPVDTAKKAVQQGKYLFGPGNQSPISPKDVPKAQQKAQNLPQDIKDKVSRMGPQDNLQLLSMVEKGVPPNKIRAFVDEAVGRQMVADKKLAGNALQAASLGLGGGGLTKAAQAGTKALATATAETVIGGAAGNAGYTIANDPNASGMDILKSAAIGGGIGLGLAGVGMIGGEASKALKARGAPPVSAEAVHAITDTARLLPEHAGVGAEIVSNPAIAGAQNPALAVIQKGADIKNVRRLKVVQNQIDKFAQEGGISAERAKALLNERAQLLESIRNPQTPIGKAISELDAKLPTASPSTRSSQTTPTIRAFGKEIPLTPKNGYEAVDTASGTKVYRKTSMQGSNTKGTKQAVTNFYDSKGNKINQKQFDAYVSGELKDSPTIVTSPQEIKQVQREKTFLQEQAVADAKASSIAEDLSPSVSSAQPVDGVPVYGTGKLTPDQQSLKTEALAVKNGITEVAGDPRLTPSGTQEQWTTKVLATMSNDYEQAKKIATGLAPPPEGVPPNAFYRGVEARAIRENDGATIKALLDGPLGATSKAQGQNISALAMKNSESPLDMMKTVINARKKSNLNIPKTISTEEANTITKLSNELAVAREAVAGGADRRLYGVAHANLYDYTNTLTEAAGKKTLREALSHPLQSAVKVAGVSKSLRATLDNSGLLRQGWKVLTTHPTTWAKNSVKSFEDLVRAFGDRNVMKEIHADVVSRPNAMNGLYKRMGVDLFGTVEEAFPSSFPEKIPIFRRFYNASDAAYTGFLQRSRADLADKYLEIAAKSGVDLSSKKELQAIGKMVNSLTSRGHLGPAGEKASTVLNNVFFSPRMLKSNIDVLGGQVITGAGGSNFVRKRAAMNLVKMVMSAGAVLKLADAMKPGSVEWDPKSSNFGKVKVGDTRFDVTGGMSGLVTLAVRQAKRETKSSTTGIVSKLDTGEPFSQSSWDSAFDFLENKYSPAAAVIRDWRKGEDFSGDKPTAGSTIQNLIEPLIIGNYRELKDNPRAANLLLGMIAEGLGVSVNTYSITSNWDNSTGKTLKGFKENVGDKKFKEANTKYDESFNSWFDGVRKSDQFSKLSMEDRKQLLTDKRTALQKDIMNSYGFQYKPMSKDEETKRLINDLKNMKQ